MKPSWTITWFSISQTKNYQMISSKAAKFDKKLCGLSFWFGDYAILNYELNLTLSSIVYKVMDKINKIIYDYSECLTPLLTIFKIYRGGHLYFGREDNLWPCSSNWQTFPHKVSSTPGIKLMKHSFDRHFLHTMYYVDDMLIQPP